MLGARRCSPRLGGSGRTRLKPSARDVLGGVSIRPFRFPVFPFRSQLSSSLSLLTPSSFYSTVASVPDSQTPRTPLITTYSYTFNTRRYISPPRSALAVNRHTYGNSTYAPRHRLDFNVDILSSHHYKDSFIHGNWHGGHNSIRRPGWGFV